MADGNGQGFANIAGGVGSILGGLFGTNGGGDDIAEIITAGKSDPNKFPYGYTGNPYSASGNVPWMMILLVGAGAFVLYLIFKKK